MVKARAQFVSAGGTCQAKRQERTLMNWKDQYRAALVEVNPDRLLGLIHDAEAAMRARSESLPAVTLQELQEMGNANWALSILKSHVQAACT